jgi:exonuclease III
LSELALFCSKNKEPYLLCGDFNIIRFSSEKNNSNPIHRHSDTFNAIINAYELRELVMTGGIYTWSND